MTDKVVAKLTPADALKNLGMAAAAFKGDLKEHQALQESLHIVEEIVNAHVQQQVGAVPKSDPGAPASPDLN